MGGNSYTNADVCENHFIRSVEHREIFLSRRLNPNCYPTAKLNERKLCMVQHFLGLGYYIILSRTYNENYSRDFLRLRQHTDPICIESLDEECILMEY